MSKTISTIALLIVVLGVVFVLGNKPENNNINIDTLSNTGFGAGQKAIVYKSSTCGCCVGYADELKKQGFEVEVVETNDMDSVKSEYGIPADKQSCHTIAMGDYFIEGHVPMEAVEKLLTEQPDIDGIGLPRMPSGTPGMPGPKRAPYEVYQDSNRIFGEFLTI